MAKRNIKVAVKRLEDGKTYRFNSIKECANELKLSETAIQNCLRGKWKQTKGYELIRVEDIPEELVWIWIGTKYHQVDKIANVLGMHLGKKYRLKSMFVNGSNISPIKKSTLAPKFKAFSLATQIAFSDISVAVRCICFSSKAKLIAIQPEPVPISTTSTSLSLKYLS